MNFLVKLMWRHMRRRPGRTVFTTLGVASAMLLYVAVESLSHGFEQALDSGDRARTLIVYRMNRYCPMTSHLPERYVDRIAEVEGVVSVLPVKVHLSNCRASLDVVAFQGAPVESMLATRQLEIIAGDANRFQGQANAALVGEDFAARRGIGPGDSFRFGEIIVDVAGVFQSVDPIYEGLILTHLEYLQRSGPVNRLGTVTQFEVKIDDANNARRIANEIDSLFRTAEEPTDTRASLQFLADATRELREILGLARLFGIVCFGVVLVLVANTVLVSVRERRGEFGVYLTIGYRGRHILAMVLSECFALTLAGAALGLIGAFCLIYFSHLSIGVEGITVSFSLSANVFGTALSMAALAALVAGIVPAIQAARSRVTELLGSL